MKVLVLGASGMIGSTMLRVLGARKGWQVAGTVRSGSVHAGMPLAITAQLIRGVDLADGDSLVGVLREYRPDVVVNCAGLTKHVPGGNDPVPASTINTLMPHRVAGLCQLSGARFIHVSTDCVFSGRKGTYSETDPADAQDVYGKTKYLGEVTMPGAITLRTSTIGHELGTRFGLLEWFLSQSSCQGYRRAIFSGLPTVEFARVVRDIVIPDLSLSGLYHVGAEPIDKERLLRLIAREYGVSTLIEPDDSVAIDRSLDSRRFAEETGYRAADWATLIRQMHDDRL